jgi:hypothetical protein
MGEVEVRSFFAMFRADKAERPFARTSAKAASMTWSRVTDFSGGMEFLK